MTRIKELYAATEALAHPGAESVTIPAGTPLRPGCYAGQARSAPCPRTILTRRIGALLMAVALLATGAAALDTVNNPDDCTPDQNQTQWDPWNCDTQPSVTLESVTWSADSKILLTDSVTASTTATTGNGTATKTGKDNCGNSVTAPDSPATVSPSLGSATWSVSGPGDFTASGSGLSATFTPTKVGQGTVTFTQPWTADPADHGCIGGSATKGPAYYKVYNVAFISNTVNASIDDGSYNAADNLTNTYDTANLDWTISPSGTGEATINGSGLVTFGTQGNSYTVTATSRDLSRATSTFTLNVFSLTVKTKKKGATSWDPDGTTTEIATGGLATDIHFADVEVEVKPPSLISSSLPLKISLAGDGDGYEPTTGQQWWWPSSYHKRALMTVGSSTYEHGVSTSPIEITSATGSSTGGLRSGNKVETTTVRAEFAGVSKDKSVKFGRGDFDFDVPTDATPYEWVDMSCARTLGGTPLEGHHLVFLCEEVEQPDSTVVKSVPGDSASASYGLESFVWVGSHPSASYHTGEGISHEVQVDSSGVAASQFNVRGSQKRIEMRVIDLNVAEHLTAAP